jgi:hypothetical protein
MKLLATLLSVLILTVSAISQDQSRGPLEVVDAPHAIKIAETALIQKFGKKITSERPFTAVLKEDTWLVTGNAHCGAPHCFGAPAAVEISKSNGHILAVYGPKK